MNKFQEIKEQMNDLENQIRLLDSINIKSKEVYMKLAKLRKEYYELEFDLLTI